MAWAPQARPRRRRGVQRLCTRPGGGTGVSPNEHQPHHARPSSARGAAAWILHTGRVPSSAHQFSKTDQSTSLRGGHITAPDGSLNQDDAVATPRAATAAGRRVAGRARRGWSGMGSSTTAGRRCRTSLRCATLRDPRSAQRARRSPSGRVHAGAGGFAVTIGDARRPKCWVCGGTELAAAVLAADRAAG